MPLHDRRLETARWVQREHAPSGSGGKHTCDRQPHRESHGRLYEGYISVSAPDEKHTHSRNTRSTLVHAIDRVLRRVGPLATRGKKPSSCIAWENPIYCKEWCQLARANFSVDHSSQNFWSAGGSNERPSGVFSQYRKEIAGVLSQT